MKSGRVSVTCRGEGLELWRGGEGLGGQCSVLRGQTVCGGVRRVRVQSLVQSVGSYPHMDGHPSGVLGTGRVAVTRTSHGSCSREETVKHNHLFQIMVSATHGKEIRWH